MQTHRTHISKWLLGVVCLATIMAQVALIVLDHGIPGEHPTLTAIWVHYYAFMWCFIDGPLILPPLLVVINHLMRQRPALSEAILASLVAGNSGVSGVAHFIHEFNSQAFGYIDLALAVASLVLSLRAWRRRDERGLGAVTDAPRALVAGALLVTALGAVLVSATVSSVFLILY